MPLASGYSRDTIARNIRKLIQEGVPQDQAVAAAYREARRWFNQYNPGASFPEYLRRTPNPLTKRELRLSRNEKTRQENKKHLTSLPEKQHFLTGFVVDPHGPKPLIQQAKQRYSGFMKRAATRSETLTVPALPKVALAIGEVVELHYASKRDGESQIYRHVFKSGSRPLLASSHDGKQLILLGGAFRFTRRGIVDR